MRGGARVRAGVLAAVVAGTVALWAAPSGADDCDEGDCVDGGTVGVVEVEAPEDYWDPWLDPGWGWGGGYDPRPQPELPADPGGGPGPGLGGEGPDDVNLRKEGQGLRGTREALAREGCRTYLSGPAGDAATVFQRATEGGRLRMDPLDNGERTGPDGTVRQYGAITTGTGDEARIEVYGPYYFDATMQRQLVDAGVEQPLTAEQGRALLLLHEVGHATGAYGDHSEAELARINREIYARCLAS